MASGDYVRNVERFPLRDPRHRSRAFRGSSPSGLATKSAGLRSGRPGLLTRSNSGIGARSGLDLHPHAPILAVVAKIIRSFHAVRMRLECSNATDTTVSFWHWRGYRSGID